MALDRADAVVARGAAPATNLLQARDRGVSCARAHTPDDTEWNQIPARDAAPMEMPPASMAKLNLALAAGMAFGPAADCEVFDALESDCVLRDQHVFPRARAFLPEITGVIDEAVIGARAGGSAHRRPARACAFARSCGDLQVSRSG